MATPEKTLRDVIEKLGEKYRGYHISFDEKHSSVKIAYLDFLFRRLTISDEDFVTLIQACSAYPGLKSLSIGGIKSIDGKAYDALSEYIRTTTTLEKLNLDKDDSYEIGGVFYEAILQNNTLTEFFCVDFAADKSKKKEVLEQHLMENRKKKESTTPVKTLGGTEKEAPKISKTTTPSTTQQVTNNLRGASSSSSSNSSSSNLSVEMKKEEPKTSPPPTMDKEEYPVLTAALPTPPTTVVPRLTKRW